MATVSSTIQLVDRMSETLSKIEGNINSMKDTLKSVSDKQADIDGFSWNTFLSNAEAAGEKMVGIGKKMTVAMTTPLVMLGKKLYGTATDYESAFAGVKKTTEATEEEYNQLYEGLLQIAETNPTGFVDAAGIMEMAGQLGVAKEELIRFTEAYIGLQESTNINGEGGAADIARFLNVTEKSTANINRVGGVIVGLGNNFATTEQEILAMATRMGATADLAGFSSAEILAFSAALSSVGINAEAGGSAAGKLMKKMQLAAEVGGDAAKKIEDVTISWKNPATGDYVTRYLKDMVDSGLDFVNYLTGAKKDDKVDIANQLGMTVEAVNDLADNWLLFDQFSEVMGITGKEFLSGWKESPAQSLLNFFQGLGNLDTESGNSVLAQLAEMDITEIRLSNLVAAMTGNSEIFQKALEEAYKQYNMDVDTNAMAEEVAKRYETQESQNAMLGNKLENSMADLGDNLVKAVQPALDKVNELLNAFNSLSEGDQDKIITAFAIFAVGGPIVTAVGATIEAVGKIGQGIEKVISFAQSGKLAAVFTNPATWGIVAGAGILLLISYLDSIPSKFETLAKGARDIPITIDETAYGETISKISEVQAALDGLKGGEIKEEYENTSTAVTLGYGTNEMFGTSLAYQAAKTNAAINDVASEYAAKMNEVQQEMIDAVNAGNTNLADQKFAELEGLRATLNSELDAIKGDYTSKLSELFNGMASQYPEAASALADAASNYDLALAVDKAMNFDWNSFDDYGEAEKAFDNLMRNTYTKAWDAGYMGDYDTQEEMLKAFEGNWNSASWLPKLMEDATEALQGSIQTVSDNPVLASWLQAMITDPNITENMDMTQLNGALEGIVKALDFKSALEQSGDNVEDFGKYVSEGLGNGITDNASLATDSASNLGNDVINNLKLALGVSSPSIFMIESGLFLDQGLMIGIQQGQSMVIAAMNSLGNQVIAVARSVLSPGAGSQIGYQFVAGMASGISSGSSAVGAAAAKMVQSALASANSAAGIHSPSKETYWSGSMMIQGYINALSDGSNAINKTIGRVIGNSETSWNNGIWNMIGSFADTEAQAWQDELNDVEDKVTISDADVQKIRTLAEREVINRFTTAEIKVEMNNTNNINSDMDIDGVITRLEERVTERLEAVAEGVYV